MFGPCQAERRGAGINPNKLEMERRVGPLNLAKLISGEPDRQTEAEAEFAQVRTLDPTLMPAAPAAPAPEAAASPAAPPSGATAPPAETTSAPPPPAASAAPLAKIRDLDRKFMLTHDSPVYQAPQDTANVIAQVHRRKFVHVTGITGNWFRIEMKNGTVGFIPLTAAE